MRAGLWVIDCQKTQRDRACGVCGCLEPRIRSSRIRWITHTPIGQCGVVLRIRVRLYECVHCWSTWSENLDRVAAPGRQLSFAAIWWAIAEISWKSKSIRACALDLYCSWVTVNTAVLETTDSILVTDPTRLDGVRVLGVDEHVWRHTSTGSRYVTVLVDLTGLRSGKSARLLDMIEGRSEHVVSSWLAGQSRAFRDNIQVVAMDAFTGFKNASAAQLPHACDVMDPFHVVKLAADKVSQVRCRLQREETGQRGTKNDPLYRHRRSLLKSQWLRTDKQALAVKKLLDAYPSLKLAHDVYQRIIDCYREKNRKKARRALRELIDALAQKGSSPHCPELATLGRTLAKRRDDVLAYFTFAKSSNGPTEAINGRLETLRGIALGFRQPENYRLRSLLHSGGFTQTIRAHIHTTLHTPYTQK
ncbi:ISL3 family transposase [Alloscardovia macacae]|uniref:Transposase n=1 Tax=Alloscardovia macacae TaxID=1160091 RepID=A0A261F749_9BIFI|nr:ISL3 family transposase [Alloscardovia macacae]OZG54970.1 transposase [Alloscardovia macacae]